MGQLYQCREKLFVQLMYSFSKHLLNICSGSASDTKMKRCRPVLKELIVLIMSERPENSPFGRWSPVGMRGKYSESFEKPRQSFPGGVRKGCMEVVFKPRPPR